MSSISDQNILIRAELFRGNGASGRGPTLSFPHHTFQERVIVEHIYTDALKKHHRRDLIASIICVVLPAIALCISTFLLSAGGFGATAYIGALGILVGGIATPFALFNLTQTVIAIIQGNFSTVEERYIPNKKPQQQEAQPQPVRDFSDQDALFFTLPSETLGQILESLSPKDIGHCFQTCKKLNAFKKDVGVLKSLAQGMRVSIQNLDKQPKKELYSRINRHLSLINPRAPLRLTSLCMNWNSSISIIEGKCHVTSADHGPKGPMNPQTGKNPYPHFESPSNQFYGSIVGELSYNGWQNGYTLTFKNLHTRQIIASHQIPDGYDGARIFSHNETFVCYPNLQEPSSVIVKQLNNPDSDGITIQNQYRVTAIRCTDDHLFLGLDDGSIKIYTANGQEEVGELPSQANEQRNQAPVALASSNNLLFAVRDNKSVLAWNIETGRLLKQFKVNIWTSSIEVDPHSPTLYLKATGYPNHSNHYFMTLNFEDLEDSCFGEDSAILL